jgi:hypothetical protein
MALFDSEAEILLFSSTFLLLLLNAHNTLGQHVEAKSEDNHGSSTDTFTPLGEGSILDANQFTAAVVHNFRLCIVFSLLD